MARRSPRSLLLMPSNSSRGLARVFSLTEVALELSKWVTPSMSPAVSSSAARSLPKPPLSHSRSPLVPLVFLVAPSAAGMVSAALSLAGSPRLPALASVAPLATIVRLVSSLRSGDINRLSMSLRDLIV